MAWGLLDLRTGAAIDPAGGMAVVLKAAVDPEFAILGDA
jgi:hypothetical protein